MEKEQGRAERSSQLDFEDLPTLTHPLDKVGKGCPLLCTIREPEAQPVSGEGRVGRRWLEHRGVLPALCPGMELGGKAMEVKGSQTGPGEAVCPSAGAKP